MGTSSRLVIWAVSTRRRRTVGIIEPKYLPDICDSPATAPLAITNSGMFDPNLDANCNGGVVVQAGGPVLCVVHYSSDFDHERQHVDSGRNVQQDQLGRAIAFVSDDDLTIDGTLDVSAHGPTSGPRRRLAMAPVAPEPAPVPLGLAVPAQRLTVERVAAVAANGGGAVMDPGSLTTLVGEHQHRGLLLLRATRILTKAAAVAP